MNLLTKYSVLMLCKRFMTGLYQYEHLIKHSGLILSPNLVALTYFMIRIFILFLELYMWNPPKPGYRQHPWGALPVCFWSMLYLYIFNFHTKLYCISLPRPQMFFFSLWYKNTFDQFHHLQPSRMWKLFLCRYFRN